MSSMNKDIIDPSSPDTRLWTITLIGVLILTLICPFVINARRRRLCCKGFRRLALNSTDQEEDEDEDDGPVLFVRSVFICIIVLFQKLLPIQRKESNDLFDV